MRRKLLTLLTVALVFSVMMVTASLAFAQPVVPGETVPGDARSGINRANCEAPSNAQESMPNPEGIGEIPACPVHPPPK